jgi:hypothetical protein
MMNMKEIRTKERKNPSHIYMTKGKEEEHK